MDKQLGKPVLWEPSSGVQNRLREPKFKVSTGGTAQRMAKQEHSTSAEPTNKTTILRADAPEFVPTWLKSTTNDIEHQFQNIHITVGDGPYVPKHSAQERLSKYKSSSHTESCHSDTSDLLNGCYDKESPDMIRLRQVISSLIKYPGQFDDLLMVFMETIYPYFNDIIAMSEIAQLLVGQAIDCPNFRYNGVRLCWYVEQKCPAFRAELHLRCQKELQENLNQQNVVLFIAELYTQLPHDSLYGSLLIDSLNRLMIIGGNDNIKCVCQALKLTGFSLEQSQRQALDDLFIQLGKFKDTLSGSALVVLNSVVNLRQSNWGRSAMDNHINSESSDYDHDYEEMVNGLLYETEGNALTNEEQEFLVAHATNDEYVIDNEDPDALCDPEDEMDEEIQAAFEEFVKLSKG